MLLLRSVALFLVVCHVIFAVLLQFISPWLGIEEKPINSCVIVRFVILVAQRDNESCLASCGDLHNSSLLRDQDFIVVNCIFVCLAALIYFFCVNDYTMEYRVANCVQLPTGFRNFLINLKIIGCCKKAIKGKVTFSSKMSFPILSV